MVVVGLIWVEVKERCFEGVRLVCYNVEDIVIIFGDVIVVNKFVQELKEEGIFVKEVNIFGVVFYFRYMVFIVFMFKELLMKFIVLKKRLLRWISIFIFEDRWDIELVKYFFVDYYVNNLVSLVLF